MITGSLPDPPRAMAVSVDAIRRLLSEIGNKAIKRTTAGAKDQAPLIAVEVLAQKENIQLFNDLDFKAALAAFGRKDNAEAVRCIKLAIGRFPESPACHVLLGSYQSALKNWAEAEAAYERAIELRNDYADAWGYLGAVLSLEGKVEPALIALRRALAFKPASENSLGALGLVCIVSKRYAEAHSVLKKLEALPSKEAAEKAAALKKMLSEKERK